MFSKLYESTKVRPQNLTTCTCVMLNRTPLEHGSCELKVKIEAPRVCTENKTKSKNMTNSKRAGL